MEFQFGFIVAENLVNEFMPELRQMRQVLRLPGRRDVAVH